MEPWDSTENVKTMIYIVIEGWSLLASSWKVDLLVPITTFILCYNFVMVLRKKSETTPKKNKHKRRKVELATLKLQKGNENGKSVVFVKSAFPVKGVQEFLWSAIFTDTVAKCCLIYCLKKPEGK